MGKTTLEQLEAFIGFVALVEAVDDDIWFSRIAESKWSIHDVVTHMMKWDEYFNEVTFPSIVQNEDAELMEHPDYLAYNEQSIAYGNTKSKSDIIAETYKNRLKMIENLGSLSEDTFNRVYPGEREFTLKTYLEAFFTSHDQHHIRQVQKYLTDKG